MRRILRPGGLFALEIGYDQGATVSALARLAGLAEIAVVPDLAGHDRVVIGCNS
jgi:release factor glutamine methyltransferase